MLERGLTGVIIRCIFVACANRIYTALKTKASAACLGLRIAARLFIDILVLSFPVPLPRQDGVF